MLNDTNNKLLLVLIGLYLFTENSFSQTYYSNKESSSFGFTVGLTSSDIYRDTIKYESGIFFNAGFVYTLAVTGKANIGIEILYSGKAVKRSKPIVKYRFGFVDIPFYYQLKLSDNFKLNAGIQYSKFILSQYDTLDGGNSAGVHTEHLKTKMDDDVGLLAGLEFGVSKNLFVSARYTLSSKSFLEKNSAYFGVFQLSFKYVVFRGYKQLFNKKQETAATF